ncbi:glutamate synthase large subunit [Leadbettera azotonutricia]|uniref:Glutamate synthase [NADPH] large chain n=1 Tax=Leadbettera azotonutricia (strain ATCC BAA-888 / DSM 13862 / ZAS-9) TaxID=545695 RepID=F5YDW9_LEAAZ|nr:glutamate synthase large subunit [Leadbettera azotonutricia]AEF80549.1 glutamate synthase [NADPH] large chain (nadph-gogat) [Leadbettera azotonutricia ZAS-9]
MGGQGLYLKEHEHDSCGIGFVADIKGRKSHDILKRGLEVLERMEHRGAESADNKTGDGSGVLLQIPHEFYKKLIPGLPEEGTYGTGLAFFPHQNKNDDIHGKVKAIIENVAKAAGFSMLALRDVPVNSNAIGIIAKSAEPVIKQLVLVPLKAKAGASGIEPSELEFSLFIFRKKLEKALEGDESLKKAGAECYFPSLSSRTIIYKGMLMSSQLKDYFPELSDSAMKTAVALVHSRFSTNTFPNWPLAQPFRMVAHNGEINTVKGNRFWMAAREALLDHPRFGATLKEILPIIDKDGSDSASFDNVLELLVMSGRSLPHALMMMIPESWNNKNPIPQELKDFYEYHACIMEPWDGPASMVFCDGRFVGGTLDRNGLRPSRYTVTKDDLIVMGSETGVQDFSPDEVAYKGRLLPGKLLLVDLEEGRIIPDAEAKRDVYSHRPYTEWVGRQVTTLKQEIDAPTVHEGGKDAGKANDHLGDAYGAALFGDAQIKTESSVLFMERSAGYTREDREQLLIPMALTGQEPTSSMGTDTPIAVFSNQSQRVYSYFKQVFAQVTNPPIDSIREDLVMTLTSFVGPQENLLDETENHCRRIKVLNPIMTPADLEALKELKPSVYKSKTLDATFEASGAQGASLEKALDRLVDEAVKAVNAGASLLILSDREALLPEAGKAPVPALLAVGAVHHGLIRKGLRMKASIIAESAEPREIMHFALLFGYGADLIVPYGALASIAAICRGADSKRVGDFAHAKKAYLKGLAKAMLKVMSKMGTSTLRSYRGAQIFEAIGLGPEVIDTCFRGTTSRIKGAGFAELEAEALSHYANAKEAHAQSETIPAPGDYLLDGAGQYRWRKYGEKHAWNPETIHLLQWSTRTGDYAKFKQFTEAANTLNQSPHVIRGLLDFVQLGKAIPIEEVESVDEIMKRFTTGAMSFGSISKEAHETVAEALNSIKGRSNSGEGGEDAERFPMLPDGRWLRSAIKQVASARFGVTSEYLANARELQIKIAQGAKPGEGGQLPGHKVASPIARTRHSTPGVTLISPPPHHDIYSIEDLAELIFDLKNANPGARISVKLVSESGVGTIAAGVAKAHADNILISGYDGGTGASPQSSIRHAGLPWELGLSETHQVLVRNGLRGRVRLQTDGQLKTGRDIVIAAMLGAEEFGFGTSTLIVLGCVMMRKCHENTCPMGVATQDPELRKRFTGKAAHLINFFHFLAEETREIMASLGFKHFDDLVGRADLLVQRKIENRDTLALAKAAGVDLSALLYKAEGPADIPGGQALHCVTDQIHKISDILDRKLIDKCLAALDRKIPTALQFSIKNTDRAVGAMLSYEVSKRFGGEGLPENFVTVDFAGSAGQSFGAFLARGITFRLSGDANDYLGKGLSGGRIVVAPPQGSAFKTSENIIIGNTVLYGATSGELYVAGVAGERFGVRNSGALAVVEGTGDHAAEYMTGGRLVVLGAVGRNFAAGMSGGIAYVLNLNGNFEFFLNKGMVELSGLDNEEDEGFVKDMVRKHVYWTGSAYAKNIIDNWAEYKPKFVKVLPVEYKRALQQMKLAELDRKLYEIREREDIEVKA